MQWHWWRSFHSRETFIRWKICARWCDTVTVLWQWSSMNHPAQRFQRVDTWCKAIAKYLNWFSRFVVDDIRPTSGSQKSENQRKFCKALTVAVTCANVFFNFRIAITRLGINDMAPVRLFNSHVLYIGTLYLSQLQSFYDAIVTKSTLDETAFLRTKTVVSGKSKAHYPASGAYE